MTGTGPQKYPGASQAYRYQGTWSSTPMETNVIAWHSTEGTSLPDYANAAGTAGAVAPNFTAVPDFAARRMVWYQHFDFDSSARALVNASGGVETNTANVCQVEIVGTCDPKTHAKWGSQHLYMADLPDWAIRDLAAFAKWANVEHGVKLQSGLTFKAYDASYGADNGVRMTGTQWRGFYGHCGHQHVPENLHGDPGAFPMQAILDLAKGNATPTPAQEDDMTPEQAKQLAELHNALTPYQGWGYRNAAAQQAAQKAGKSIPDTYGYLTGTHAAVQQLTAQVGALSATITTLAGLIGKSVDTAAVVAAVQKSIAAAVVHVDVAVTGSTPKEG